MSDYGGRLGERPTAESSGGGQLKRRGESGTSWSRSDKALGLCHASRVWSALLLLLLASVLAAGPAYTEGKPWELLGASVGDDGSVLGFSRCDDQNAVLWLWHPQSPVLLEIAKDARVGVAEGSSPSGWSCFSAGEPPFPAWFSRGPAGEVNGIPGRMAADGGDMWRLRFVRYVVSGSGLAVVHLDRADDKFAPPTVGVFDLARSTLMGVLPPGFEVSVRRASPLLGLDGNMILLSSGVSETSSVSLWQLRPMKELDCVEVPGIIERYHVVGAEVEASDVLGLLVHAPYVWRLGVSGGRVRVDAETSLRTRTRLGLEGGKTCGAVTVPSVLPFSLGFGDGVYSWVDDAMHTLVLATERDGGRNTAPLPEGASSPNLCPAASPNNRWFVWQTGEDELTLYERTGVRITKRTTVRLAR